MVISKQARLALAGASVFGLALASACSTLKPGEGASGPDAGGLAEKESPDAAPSPLEGGATDDARAVDPDASAPDTSAPDASKDAALTDDPGPLEPFVGNLLAGLGVSVSTEHVYWLEQGARAGAGSNFDAIFRRRALTATPCAAGDNCGSWLPTAGRTFFGDAHTGTLSSDAMTCLSVIYNGTRDTDLHCLRHGAATMDRVPVTQFASSVRLVVGTDLYFSVPARAPATTTALRSWSALTPTVAPVDVITRTATEITDVAIDGDTMFWVESTGSGASAASAVWLKQGAAAPVQIAPPRAGPARIAVDAGYVYATHLSDGKVERHARTPGGAGAGVQIATAQAGVGPILRRGAYLLWLNYGPAPDYTASQVVRAKPDGTGQIVIDNEETISDLAATADTAYMVTFGKDPNYVGTIKRVRFTR